MFCGGIYIKLDIGWGDMFTVPTITYPGMGTLPKSRISGGGSVPIAGGSTECKNTLDGEVNFSGYAEFGIGAGLRYVCDFGGVGLSKGRDFYLKAKTEFFVGWKAGARVAVVGEGKAEGCLTL